MRASSPAATLLLAVALTVPALVTLSGSALPAPSGADTNLDGTVVVAVVDTGINPYHADFAAPGLDDPRALIPEYPTNATPLALTLDADSYSAARDADVPVYESLQKGRLYHVPGTKIVGAFVGGGTNANTAEDVLPLLDEDGHGTAAASLAVGNVHGACPECLLVVVDGWRGLEWATEQKWIDVVSNSWGTIGNVGVPLSGAGYENDWTRRAAERGQTVVFAAGNGNANAYLTPEQTYLSNTNGPDWVVNVGSAVRDEDGSRAVFGTGRPVDVVADGLSVPAAAVASLTGEFYFSGTSAAAPIVAGVFAETLRQVRAAVEDDRTGQSWSQSQQWFLARGPRTAGGAFEDGLLTRAELWDAVQRSATPTASWVVGVYPPTLPRTSLAWADALNEGYGYVDAASADAASAHLLGTQPLPAREDVAFFFGLDAFYRDLMWGSWDRDGDGLRERYALPEPALP